MKKGILLLPLLLLAMMATAEPVVRVVSTNGTDKTFATDDVHKLVLASTAVDVISAEGSVILSVPLAELARVEFTDGEPSPATAVEATIVKYAEAIKVIENDHVYIIRSGVKYTIMGTIVENQ